MRGEKSNDVVDAQPTDTTDAKPMSGSSSAGIGVPKFQAVGGDGEPVISAEDFFADEYKMDYPHRGKAIIINNRTFDRQLGLGERTGTDQDAAALNMRFMEMGFDVDIYHNLVVRDMAIVLGKAAGDDSYNRSSDCFACAILSHGEEGIVFGTDAKIEVKVLLEPFKGNNCKGLLGKPKLFFIQACQGMQFDSGVGVNTSDAKGQMEMEREITVYKIPSEADFLIAYSVVPGYYSWRNSANGSWFVQALSDVLAKHWHDMDLLTIMTRVNKKVAYEFESKTGKEFMNQKKQIPCITSMLTKEVLFKPKK
ncbi:caspase-3-like isoform X2 [Mercenaria mercenaria]|uniref:caspase-3-like isoform X2 n=1 Tax=Mercenaria mercenaria TaxID=6596 RepID=UPI00234F0DB7|nr:caspase-3-like isoform X2 [Mercenaria mercenaria]